MMDKNQIRKITKSEEQKTRLIDKLLQTDMTWEEMSTMSGMSVYQIRRYTGSIQ